MDAGNLLWVDGVRTSTVAMVALIGTTHLYRRQWAAALLAPPVFLFGFEVCWRAVFSREFQWPSGWASLLGVAILWTLGYRPNLWSILGAAGLMLVWVSTGFHVNYPGAGPDWGAELLNESTKSAWGAAWLLAARRPGRTETRGLPRREQETESAPNPAWIARISRCRPRYHPGAAS